jgi:hypothetical protein
MAERFTWEFRQEDVKRNIEAYGMENFLRWPVSAEALYSGDELYGHRRLDRLMRSEHRLDRYVGRFNTGNPPNDGPLDMHMVVQAHHLMTLLDTGYTIPMQGTVYEFGGGFGAMVLLLRRIGFTGKYVIQDLPEMLRLQDYWLKGEGIRENVTLTTEPIAGEYDLFIANCSLSEANEDARSKVKDLVEAHAYEICYDRCWNKGTMATIMAEWVEGIPGQWKRVQDPIFSNHEYWVAKCC